MTKTSPKIVFFGSGPVAAESLRLLQQHETVEAVITKSTTAEEMAAAAPGIPQYLVATRQELDALIAKQTFESRAGVLIDFGIIISRAVIDAFPLGILNSHFSILPEWRGADPITFAILSGQNITGVSLMLLVEKMDEGPVIAYGEQPLGGTETGPELTQQLILLSDALLKHELPKFLSGTSKGVDQDFMIKHTGKQVSYSRKLTKEDGVIDWHKPAEQIEREIRAFSGWPKSRTVLAGKDVVITQAHIVDQSGEPGKVIADAKVLLVYCGKKALSIDKLKPAGKNEMTGEAFLAGHKHLL